MTTTSDARKRREEATNPHGGRKVGTCKAEDQWRTVSCAGGGGDVEAAAFYRAVKEVFDLQCPPRQDVEYVPGAHMAHQWWTTVLGSVLDRYAALAAQPAAPQPTEGAAEVVCTNCDADDLGCTACGAHGTLAARSQRPEVALVNIARSAWSNTCNAYCDEEDRTHAPECLLASDLYHKLDVNLSAQRPEGVTVTEWKVDHRNNGCWPFEDVYANESTARFAANGRPILSRQRTTFPDAVTEWAEVPGDTEAGGDRG